MAYENIRLRKQNLVTVDGYYYMMDEDVDALIVKTDDGTQAFTYPLDTTIANTIKSIEHDGRNFWTLETVNSNSVRIRRWYIHNYVCKLRNTFDLVGGGSHNYESEAFTIEHYHVNIGAGGEAAGQANISINTGGSWALNSKLSSGMTVTLGPNSAGNIEEFTVNSVGTDYVNLNGSTSYPYDEGDPVNFYTNIWLFNNYNGTDDSTGALYKINGYTGSVMSKTAGGAYQDIKACTFYTVDPSVFDTLDVAHSLAYVKATNMIFLNPADLNNSHGSMTMDNIQSDQATVIPIYDITIYESNIYRLQRKATYYGTTYDFVSGTYNYQLSTLDSFITSISLRAEPAILPADSASESEITAVVKNQFNLPVSGKNVYFTDDDTVGTITINPVGLNAQGIAITRYKAGNQAREVRVTATVQQ